MTELERIEGVILGTAVGDAIGLPYEGISKRRQRRMFPEITGHRFLFGRGMVSDDTEHTCMVAQALIASGAESDAFGRALARRLRFWLLRLPPGIGFATLRACVKLWLGFGYERSGIFSAGSGPAMRSAILGVCFGHDPDLLTRLVRVCTRVTHTDPKAEAGALAVALAAHLASTTDSTSASADDYLALAQKAPYADLLGDAMDLLHTLKRSVTQGKPTGAFAEQLGCGKGLTGYVNHVVPVALHAWLAHQDSFEEAVIASVRCGGDTDTVAAVAGAIMGAQCGKEGIPTSWLAGLWEWPMSVTWMEELAAHLHSQVVHGRAERVPSLPTLGLMARNLAQLTIVVGHVVRRLLPPY